MKKTCHECKHSFGNTFSKCPRGELTSKAFAKRAGTICREYEWADKRLSALEMAIKLLGDYSLDEITDTTTDAEVLLSNTANSILIAIGRVMNE